MKRVTRLVGRFRNAPVIGTAVLVGLLVLIGMGAIVQSEASFRSQKQQEAQVQAAILAASVVAALDFGDAATAQEAADAMRANGQMRGVGIYDRHGLRVAGFRRDAGDSPRNVQESRRLTASSESIVGEAPVMRGGERIGLVRLSVDAQPFETRVGTYLLVGLLVIMAALVVTVLGVAQGALRRANRALGERAAALVLSNAALKVQIDEREKAEEQLRQAQKMQALGLLTGGIAHDFNNLLTVIQGSADMLCRPDLKPERRLRYAEAIVQAGERAAALTRQLLAFARRQPLRPETIDVNAMVAGMIDLFDRTLGERIAIRTELSDDACVVEADRAQLASALLNIAVNARDAMPDGGTLTISTGSGRTSSDNDDMDQPMIALSVADTGAGMDAATLARAMEPFFTTKGTGKGTGLGLSQVYGFATQSGGDLRIASIPGKGTTVTLLLPSSDKPLVAEEQFQPISGSARRTGSVLLVEDNDAVGEFAESLLSELGHRVVRARSGEEALERVHGGKFDVVLTDVVMPVMSGIELAEQLATERPELRVVLTTGFSEEIALSGAGGRPVILKPYRLETLATVLDEALA